ncbi:MAG: hypothetical protein ACRYHQ_35800 [Janthinobacterium lividum]
MSHSAAPRGGPEPWRGTRAPRASGWVIWRDAWQFHRRLFERYGGVLLEEGEVEALLRILPRFGRVVGSGFASTHSVRAVRLPGRHQVFLVVWNAEENGLITVLPEGYFVERNGVWVVAHRIVSDGLGVWKSHRVADKGPDHRRHKIRRRQAAVRAWEGSREAE